MAENSWHRYDMKKLRHCHPTYMSRDSKRLKKLSSNWLNSSNCTNTASEKNATIFVFLVLPGSAEAQVSWGGIVKRLLIAYFTGSISAKNIKICSRVSKLTYSKSKVGLFWDTMYFGTYIRILTYVIVGFVAYVKGKLYKINNYITPLLY